MTSNLSSYLIMSGVRINIILPVLTLLLTVSSVHLVSVPRICGRIEIIHRHDRPKVFYIAEVKRAKSNLTQSLLAIDSLSRRPPNTQFKKLSMKTSQGSTLGKKQRKNINLQRTTPKLRHEEKVQKRHRSDRNTNGYTNPYTLYVSVPKSRTIRTVKKIKRQDNMTQYSPKLRFPKFRAFESIVDFEKNIKLQGKLETTDKENSRKIKFLQYIKKKRNLPRLAPFTSKPSRTPPTFTKFNESHIPLRAMTRYNTIYKNNFNAATKRNRPHKISFILVSENVTDPTPVEDRVKFFEKHDQFTAAAKRKAADLDTLHSKPQVIKVFLDDVNQDISHVDDNYLYSKRDIKRGNSGVEEKVTDSLQKNKLNKKHECNRKRRRHSFNKLPLSNNNLKRKSNNTEGASWAEYPFAAVYIHKPSQVSPRLCPRLRPR